MLFKKFQPTQFLAAMTAISFFAYGELVYFFSNWLLLLTSLWVLFLIWFLRAFFIKLYKMPVWLMLNPLLFIFSGIAFFLFLENGLLQQFFIFIMAFVIYKLFFTTLLNKQNPKVLFPIYKLSSFFTLFWGYSFLYKLFVLFDIHLLILIISGFLLTNLLTFDILLRFEFKKVPLIFSSVLSILMLQWTWILFFLPTSFYVNGAVATILYIYGLDFLLVTLKEQSYSARKLAINLSLICVFLLVVFLSAVWL